MLATFEREPELIDQLISELNSFKVGFTSAGNMRADVRSKDHRGNLVIATALALWSAVGRPSGRIEVGQLETIGDAAIAVAACRSRSSRAFCSASR